MPEPGRKNFVTKSIGAHNIYSDWVPLQGVFNFSLSGTFAGTVHVQRSFDKGVTPSDVDSFTAVTEQVGYEPEAVVWYRAGIKTGGYTSGTAVVRLGQ